MFIMCVHVQAYMDLLKNVFYLNLLENAVQTLGFLSCLIP